jgi:hypothetical protein
MKYSDVTQVFPIMSMVQIAEMENLKLEQFCCSEDTEFEPFSGTAYTY